MRWTHDLFDDPSKSRVIHSNPQESTGTDFINNSFMLHILYVKTSLPKISCSNISIVS